MNRLNNLLLGHRLLAAAALLLGLAGVLTGVAIVQARQYEQAGDELVDRTLPAARLAHQLTQLVDDARGLEALHLLMRSDAEREAIEQQVAAVRQRVAARMARHPGGPGDADEQRHLQAVRERLGAYWAAQDRLFAASRRAAADPREVDAARQQLTGDSQQAWRALAGALDGWWTHVEQRASQKARQGQQAAAQVGLLTLVLLMALASAGLAVSAVMLARRQAAGTSDALALGGVGSAAEPVAGSLADIAASIDGLAPQVATLAFGVAAAAGRAGAPARELSLAAAELRSLASHAEVAARALRSHLGLAVAGPTADGPGVAAPATPERTT